MSPYKQLQAELERLHQQAETARRKEKGEVLEQIRALIVEYQLTPSDLGLTSSREHRVGALPAKYRDPQSGATWSGRGRAPRWLEGQDRTTFEI